jgi:uncharacterized protein YkwD
MKQALSNYFRQLAFKKSVLKHCKSLTINYLKRSIVHFDFTPLVFLTKISHSILLLSCFLLFNNCTRAQQRTPSVKTVETGDFRADMLKAVNQVRASGCKCGGRSMPPVPPVRWNSQLEAAAARHAKDMSVHNHFDHIGTDGSEFDRRITESGYKWREVGENIAFGYETVSAVMVGWIKSVTHCRQLMSNKVDEMGAARHGRYWVQEFGKQRDW